MKSSAFKKIGLLTLGVLAISSCNSHTPVSSSINPDDFIHGTYQNALYVSSSTGTFYGMEIADPCVVRGNDGYFYSFSTCRRVLRSEDGCEWEKYSDGIIARPKWGDEHFAAAGKPYGELWAPDVVKIKDKWIYYYSLSDIGWAAGIGYAVADEVGGPYTDMGRLFWSEETGEAESVGVISSIDQQVIFGDDGNIYMVLGSFSRIFMIQLTDDGMGLYSPDSSTPGWKYQREHKILIASNRYEGSWIFKRGDYWYYMGSSGACCSGKDSTYRVRVGKSKSLFGPYIDSDGDRMDALNEENGDLVVWAKKTNTETLAPGHNSVYKDDAGQYWWYGHCYYEYDNFKTRHLAMDKLLWDENDMPYVDGYELSYNVELPGPMIAK